MGYYIGVDIGASFVKGSLFDLEKFIVKNVIKYPSPSASNSTQSRFEIDCKHYEKIVRKILKELLLIEEEVEGIVFSTQMHGMVLVNSQLQQITPFIGWQDERLRESGLKHDSWLKLLKEKIEGIDLSKTGITFRSGLMGGTLFWLKENGILKKHTDGKALFLGDYIAAKLTKGKTVVHCTNACGSGLFDIKNNKWDEKILNALGIDASYLPDVVPIDAKVGDFPYKSRNISVFVSVGDLQAAMVGSLIGLKSNREICINIGTGSQISYISDVFHKGEHDVRSYFDNTYLSTITFIPAGRALNVIVSFIVGIGEKVYGKKNSNIWEKLQALVINKKDSQGLKADISYFENNISHERIGMFNGITEKNWTIENMFFSVLDKMAINYLTAYQKLCKPDKNDRIICSGGLAKKLHVLRQLIEEKFGRKVAISRYDEETLAGLFILSLVRIKKFSTVKEASLFVQKNDLKFL